jgi:hypothetical protein
MIRWLLVLRDEPDDLIDLCGTYFIPISAVKKNAFGEAFCNL